MLHETPTLVIQDAMCLHSVFSKVEEINTAGDENADAIDAALQNLPATVNAGEFVPLIDATKISVSRPQMPMAWRIQALAHKAGLALLEKHMEDPDEGASSLCIKTPTHAQQSAKPISSIFTNFKSPMKLHMDGRATAFVMCWALCVVFKS